MFIFACCSGDQLLQPSSVRTRDANARIRFTPKVNVPMLKSEDPRGAQANLKLLLPVSTLLVPLYGIHVTQLFHLTTLATANIPLEKSLPVSPKGLTKAGRQFSEAGVKRGLLVSSQILTKTEYLLSLTTCQNRCLLRVYLNPLKPRETTSCRTLCLFTCIR